MGTLQHISSSGKVTSLECDDSRPDILVSAAKTLLENTGIHPLYDIAKCFNHDYVDTGIRQDFNYWLDAFPLARESIEAALRHNEHKHGKGIRLSMWPIELDKAIRHAKAAYNSPRNDADCTYHVTSAAARMLKAAEAFIADHGQYVPHESIKDKLHRIKITGVNND